LRSANKKLDKKTTGRWFFLMSLCKGMKIFI
jgi:hypothetical protein